MTLVTLLLIAKIGVTLPAVAVPFLVFPKARIGNLLAMSSEDGSLYRLYGMALLALCAGYAGGIHQATNGDYPIGVLAMGLVSNAGATAVLLVTGAAKRNPALTAFFGFVAIAIAAALAFPELAMQPAF